MDDALKKRLDDHKASVVYDSDGKMHVRSELINISNGFKENKLISVIPSDSERKVSYKEAPHLFADLMHMNLNLTNACNLSCSYCYEQHRKDYGRFTVESLKKAYDWFRAVNDQPDKCFQFFGGEPLIHKKLIMDFIETYDKELEENYHNFRGTYISMCSNGLLWDDKFIDFYFGKPYTHTLISLDTFITAIDYREITPKQMDKIESVIKKITTKLGDEPQRLVIRTTLSEETSSTLLEFIERLYESGVRNLIVHPLVLDSKRGYIKWKEGTWETMRAGIFHCLEKYDDLVIKFSEGVGKREDNNCMVGSDMISIDASGDFSGCYFFTNMKGVEGVDQTILGNVYQDQIYVDRYANFQAEYNKMFETEEKCRTCDLQNFCYQCPAGNLDTGSKKMFRPDDMCQEIVKLYLDFQKDVYDKMFWRDVNVHREKYSEQYIKDILEDIGLDPELTPKQNYEKIYGSSEVTGDGEFEQCFFIQTLILQR